MKSARVLYLLPWVLLFSTPIRPQTEDCCHQRLNYGFSTQRIASATPFEGILGVDLGREGETCKADDVEIAMEVPAGQMGQADVYANIISQLPETGVQAWSFSLAIEGDGNFFIISLDGTAAARVPDGLRPATGFSLGFLCLADPAQSGGQRGVVSTLIFCLFDCPPVTLPPVGTQSILKMAVRAAEPQGAEEQVASIHLQDRLVGPCAGAPIDNVITVDASSEFACNRGSANVRFVFKPRPPSGFIRGNANGDGAINITDGVFVLNFLFLGGPRPGCMDAADSNDSGDVNLTDGISVFNFLFLGGAAPPDPGPVTCGSDPSVDTLGCVSFAACP